ncbi:MAG TPA: response regulator [Bacteroidota bacterium]|nr:response regulator [Bacteroidota bacterium]
MQRLKVCILAEWNDFTMAISTQVEHCGAAVTLASNAQEAIRKINAHEADVIITDYHMKDDQGIDHIVTVKQSRPFTPMIIIKQCADVVTSRLADSLTIHDYFVQPLALDSLPRVLALARSCFSLN